MLLFVLAFTTGNELSFAQEVNRESLTHFPASVRAEVAQWKSVQALTPSEQYRLATVLQQADSVALEMYEGKKEFSEVEIAKDRFLRNAIVHLLGERFLLALDRRNKEVGLMLFLESQLASLNSEREIDLKKQQRLSKLFLDSSIESKDGDWTMRLALSMSELNFDSYYFKVLYRQTIDLNVAVNGERFLTSLIMPDSVIKKVKPYVYRLEEEKQLAQLMHLNDGKRTSVIIKNLESIHGRKIDSLLLLQGSMREASQFGLAFVIWQELHLTKLQRDALIQYHLNYLAEARRFSALHHGETFDGQAKVTSALLKVLTENQFTELEKRFFHHKIRTLASADWMKLKLDVPRIEDSVQIKRYLTEYHEQRQVILLRYYDQLPMQLEALNQLYEHKPVELKKVEQVARDKHRHRDDQKNEYRW